ncbi:MAG: phosphotransferase family protein [SAR324 cluster bacterium]|nr:phosphotransferase family protein [SAR324 cluster bacterium]
MQQSETAPAMDELAELIPMRPDERIDAVKVAEHLEGKLPGADGRPEILQFQGGKANLTYLLRYPEQEYVLRRPPLGPVAPKAHDMGREYRVLSVLHQAFALAPRAYYFSEDPQVVGAPFLIMERRNGIVIRQEMPDRYMNQPQLFRRMSEAIVDALVELHAVHPPRVGLEKLGRPEGFVQRQVEGWYQRWEASKTDEYPEVAELMPWLRSHIPPSLKVSLVHNDFKLDNMMVDEEDPARIVGVFDWDMCTLGDPLSDLGSLLGYWAEAGDSPERSAFRVMPTHLPGFVTREEVIKRYGDKSGTDLSHIRFHEIFSLFKLAVIVQQIYVRWVRGQTQDERFRDYAPRVQGLVKAAWTELNSL